MDTAFKTNQSYVDEAITIVHVVNITLTHMNVEL